MNRYGIPRSSGRSKGLAWLLVISSFPAILAASRSSKERPTLSRDGRTATHETQEVAVEQLGRLLEVKHEAGVGTPSVAQGVRLIRAGKGLTPSLGIPLREGDRIVTDRNTQAVIGSVAGPKISLGVNSDLTLRKASGFLSLGSLLLSVNRLFRLDTKFVIAGVEGTELALAVGDGDVMALAVLKGAVRVESKTEKWAPRTYTDDEQCIARGEAEPKKLTTDAIRAFHRHDYETAVALYDRVLLGDPENAYLLNLKAYSLFKRKLLSQAIDVQTESVRVDPNYAWGYFDLARFQCAAGDFEAAQRSFETALAKAKSSGLKEKMKGDGEFRRLCGRAFKRRQPVAPERRPQLHA